MHVIAPYCHWDIPVIGQSYILFRATLAEPFSFSPGKESLETALFAPSDIPFQQLAFSSVAISLRHFVEDLEHGTFHLHHGVIHKKPKAAPNDPSTFVVKDHITLATSLEHNCSN